MAKLAGLHAEGVNDLDSYNLGVIAERERIIKLLEQETDVIYEFAYAIELIKGENK